MKKVFIFFFSFLLFFLFVPSRVLAGDEACTSPDYPNCWPQRVINEWSCSAAVIKSESFCTLNSNKIDGTESCKSKDPSGNEWCDLQQDGAVCATWWYYQGFWTMTYPACQNTGTVYVNCDTSNGKCNTSFNEVECSYQSSDGTCAENTTLRTLSCCGGGTAPTPPPGGGGGCTDPREIDVPTADCTKTGFYGKYAAARGTYDFTYSCDPDSGHGAKITCDGWNSTWDGYWNIPVGQEGDYEFRIAWNPVAKFRIDSDIVDNGFDDACPNFSTSPVIGTYYFYLASGIPILRENRYRPRWLNDSRWGNPLSYIASGAANCESVSVADRDGKGVHLEKADVDTADVGACPNTGNPVIDTAHQASATTECPVSALTIAKSLDNNKSDETKDDWLTRGAGFSYFTRNMTAGPHKVQIYYLSYGLADQPLDISYRRKVGANWTSWVHLKNLSDANCPISPCKPKCILSLTPATKSLPVGETQTFKATITNLTGTIEKVDFSKTGTAVTINPLTSNGPSFETVATANVVGNSTIYAKAYINGAIACQDSSTVNVTASAVVFPWWQVVDGDVITRGDLSTGIPSASTTLKFILTGPGGYPGVPWYNASTDLNSTTVSEKGWLVQSDYTSNRVFNSAYFFAATPNNTVINSLTDSTISDGDIESGGTKDSSGYYYYSYDGNDFGGEPLTIDDADGVRLGTRKVVIFVENAGVNIDKTINLTDGSGFLLLVTTGNINIDPLVGDETAEPDLEGVYVTDGNFNTGTGGAGDPRLYIRGTLVSGLGVNLQRDRGSADNYTEPSEYIEYGADQELLFPEDLSYKPRKWQEVAP